MTAKEFINSYKPSIMACVRSMDYKPDELARKIKEKEPKIKCTEEYRETMNVYIDETMSCDADEAFHEMVHFGRMAIQYGLDTKNLDWKVKFIVAWDISHNLTANEKEWVA